MKYLVINLILFLCLGSIGFGRLFHGTGMEMTTNGTGIYYKSLWSLTENSQITGDVGFHFDNNQMRINIFGFDSNNQSILLDFITGYRYELFAEQLAGAFRPVVIIGTGGMSTVKSFSKKNIAGIWMVKYIIGIGGQFYNRRILNEITLKFNYSKAIEDLVAFQLTLYWK